MPSTISRRLFCGAAAAASAAIAEEAFPTLQAAEQENVKLLVRGDDMGAARSINAACLDAFEKGICRSVEVLVPGPWFLDAVQQLKNVNVTLAGTILNDVEFRRSSRYRLGYGYYYDYAR